MYFVKSLLEGLIVQISFKHTPCALVVIDGFGVSDQVEGNAVLKASMPTWEMLCNTFPSARLEASGKAVGLLPGFAGNSEVGHLTLGAGRVIPSILRQFHCAIDDGSFYDNPILIARFSFLAKNSGRIHLVGLVSDGGVHSHIKHLIALFNLAVMCGIEKIFIHAFLDGRDSKPMSAMIFLKQLDHLFASFQKGSLASLHGRFYGMDRDQNWDRTKCSYDVLVGIDNHIEKYESYINYLDKNYSVGITDEFIQPVLLDDQGSIRSDDGVVFFNFRPDRARQLSAAFLDPEFSIFDRKITRKNLSFFISTTRYKDEFRYFDNDIIFEDNLVQATLLDEFRAQSSGALRSFIIAETEKYAHVTYFFRGMREVKCSEEVYILVPSIKSKDYINYPEMSAQKITDHVVKSLKKDPANFYLINYANPDMVGHSGDFNATIRACECVDRQLAILYNEFVVKRNGSLFITSDHGNAEQKIDIKTGEKLTSHTSNLVPIVIACKDLQGLKIAQNGLSICNVAPTILKFIGFSVPNEMASSMVIK